MRAAVLPLLLALSLAGCALPLVNEPALKEVRGPTDGYTPTASYLKVHVETEDGRTVMLDFDRRDWHASAIADMIDEKSVAFLAAQALPRDILNEYVVEEVEAPSEIARLRYDAMGATPQQRAEYDAEYEALLRRFQDALPEAAPTSVPNPAALPVTMP